MFIGDVDNRTKLPYLRECHCGVSQWAVRYRPPSCRLCTVGGGGTRLALGGGMRKPSKYHGRSSIELIAVQRLRTARGGLLYVVFQKAEAGQEQIARVEVAAYVESLAIDFGDAEP